MRKALWLLAMNLVALPAFAQAPEVTLTRIDCGTGTQPTRVNERFSDTWDNIVTGIRKPEGQVSRRMNVARTQRDSAR